MWAAIARVDRASLGFTPIAPAASIRLEGKQLWGNDYDAMLHIDGGTARTIAFRRVGPPDEWKWIGEQETHFGPRTYTDVDGTFRENITITFDTEYVSGYPLNKVKVTYSGEDPRLAGRFDLTLNDASPILKAWGQAGPFAQLPNGRLGE